MEAIRSRTAAALVLAYVVLAVFGLAALADPPAGSGSDRGGGGGGGKGDGGYDASLTPVRSEFEFTVKPPAQQKPRPATVKPPERVGEMLRWLTREQQSSGGWTYRVRLLIDYQIHRKRFAPLDYAAASEQLWSAEPFDSAAAGLALIRAGHFPGAGGEYDDAVARAADFLYAAAQASPTNTVPIAGRPTALSARIGPQCDAFLALQFFAELKDASGGKLAAYDGAAGRLIEKIRKGQRPDGSWDDEKAGASHAPLLGHALAVRALRAAAAAGFEVAPDVIDRAEQYAMSVDAERREWKRNGKWATDPRAKRPDWMTKPGTLGEDNGQMDEPPINTQMYVMAARLSVLYESDRAKRRAFAREADRLKAAAAVAGTGGASAPGPEDMAKLRALSDASKAARRALEAGRDVMRKSWAKVDANHAAASPAPMLFTGEDFLASQLVVDAMADCKDVEQWYPPVVQRLMSFQDADGGLRTNAVIDCKHPHHQDCCYPPFEPFPPCPKAKGCDCHWPYPGTADVSPGRPTAQHERPEDKRGTCMLPQFCAYQRFWFSRDRVFITSAGLMMLSAQTPYRDSVLGLNAVAGKENVK